jgi:transcription initiation factor IIE alpha subunit
MNHVWDPIPVHTRILEILEKKKAMNDDELYKILYTQLNNVGKRELNKVLLKLEIKGLIRVSNLTKNKKRVELIGK